MHATKFTCDRCGEKYKEWHADPAYHLIFDNGAIGGYLSGLPDGWKNINSKNYCANCIKEKNLKEGSTMIIEAYRCSKLSAAN